MAKNATSFKKKDPRINTTGLNKGSRWEKVQLKENLKWYLQNKAEGKDVTYQELFIKRVLADAISKGKTQITQMIWEAFEGKAKAPVEITAEKPLLDLLRKKNGTRNNHSG